MISNMVAGVLRERSTFYERLCEKYHGGLCEEEVKRFRCVLRIVARPPESAIARCLLCVRVAELLQVEFAELMGEGNRWLERRLFAAAADSKGQAWAVKRAIEDLRELAGGYLLEACQEARTSGKVLLESSHG